jgi:hypothetical protein
MENIDWKAFEQSAPVINFLRDIAQYYSSEFIVLPYISALVGVTSVLETLQDQFT